MKKKNQGGVEHCFAISEDGQPIIEGLEKVINEYRKSLENVELWGPSLYSPVLE